MICDIQGLAIHPISPCPCVLHVPSLGRLTTLHQAPAAIIFIIIFNGSGAFNELSLASPFYQVGPVAPLCSGYAVAVLAGTHRSVAIYAQSIGRKQLANSAG
mmetsp:Transcript_4746/g.14519  ORF Transcript_4746/g.14519 Transcript_4746/m.14519 type:complete len:102 (+) Transcript_4746:2375-2680(+)